MAHALIRRENPRAADTLRWHAAHAARRAFGPPKRMAYALGVGVRHARKICEDGGILGRALEIVASASEPHHLVSAVRIAARVRELAGMTTESIRAEYERAKQEAQDAALKLVQATMRIDELTPEQQISVLDDIGRQLGAAGERLAAATQRLLEQRS
jgi:hypothetical protein